MENKTIPFSYEEYDSPDELQSEDRELLSHAKEALKHAYAPILNIMSGRQYCWKTGRYVPGTTRKIWRSRRAYAPSV